MPSWQPPIAVVEPTAADTYRLRVCLNTAAHEQLLKARAMLRHKVPSGDFNVIIALALNALTAQLQSKKYGLLKEQVASPDTRTQGAPRSTTDTKARTFPRAGAAGPEARGVTESVVSESCPEQPSHPMGSRGGGAKVCTPRPLDYPRASREAEHGNFSDAAARSVDCVLTPGNAEQGTALDAAVRSLDCSLASSAEADEKKTLSTKAAPMSASAVQDALTSSTEQRDGAMLHAAPLHGVASVCAAVKTVRGGRRAIPRAVKRAVYQRDRGECTFVASDGRACKSAAFLEFDHAVPHALGGSDTVDNLRLRCRAHNLMAAELVFGSFVGRRYKGAAAGEAAQT